MCVCIFVYMCMCVRIYACMLCTHMYVSIVCVHCVYVCVRCVYVCMGVYVCVHGCVCICVYVHVCAYMCMYIVIYVCVHMCVYTVCMCVFSMGHGFKYNSSSLVCRLERTGHRRRRRSPWCNGTATRPGKDVTTLPHLVPTWENALADHTCNCTPV